MTVSATGPLLASPATSTALSILASVSASTAQEANTKIISAIDQDIQNQLNTKLAALQQPADSAVANALQAQINALNAQQGAISTLSQSSVQNAGILSDPQTQLSDLQTDAAGGNSASFDTALTAANTDVLDLTPTHTTPPFQSDQVSSLVGNGLGIGNSASYDLTTPAGQAAAEAAINSAQTFVGQVFALTNANELVANDAATALSSQISNLNNQIAATGRVVPDADHQRDQPAHPAGDRPGASDRAQSGQHLGDRPDDHGRHQPAAALHLGVPGAAGGRDTERNPEYRPGDPVAAGLGFHQLSLRA